MFPAGRIAAIVAVLGVPAAAAAEGAFALGAGVGIHAFSEGRAYEGRAVRFLTYMGGDTEGSRRADWAVVPLVTESWRFHRYLAVEVTESYWETAVKGVFTASPEVNYRIATSAWPITAALKIVVVGDEEEAGATISAGPGMYVVTADERGWLGNGGGTSVRFGAHLAGGFFVHLSDSWLARGDISWDWFTLDTRNALMGDGGDGGGFTVSGGVEYRL